MMTFDFISVRFSLEMPAIVMWGCPDNFMGQGSLNLNRARSFPNFSYQQISDVANSTLVCNHKTNHRRYRLFIMAKSSGPTKLDKKSKSATTTTSKSSKDDSKSKSKPKKVSLKVVGANRFPLSEEIVEDSDSGDEMNVDEPFFKQRSKKQPVFEDKSQKEESQEEDDDMEQDTESEEEEPAKSGEEDFVTKENEESAEEDEESAVEEESGGEQDCVEERTTLNLKMLPAVFRSV
jgi:hypothetical protein